MRNLTYVFVSGAIFFANTAMAQYFVEYTPQKTTNALGPGQYLTYSNHPPALTSFSSEEEILWDKIVWFDVDVTEKANAPFLNSTDKPGQTTLASMLLEGVATHKFRVYSASDNKFAAALSSAEFMTLLFGRGSQGFDPEKVPVYRIQEKWEFNKKTNKITAHITGIAPLKQTAAENGKVAMEPEFWVSYAEAKEFLSSRMAADPAADKIFRWTEFLESRNFSGSIIKIGDQQFTH